MLNKTTGSELLAYMEQENTKDPHILVRFTEFAKRKSNVDLQIITSPDDQKVMNFLASLYGSKFAQSVVSNDIKVNLGYTVLHCGNCQEQGYTMPKDNCLSGGRYCMKSVEFGDESVNGETMLIQALKNNCTEKILLEGPNKRIHALMEYYWTFNASCIKSFSPRCSNKILTKLGIKDEVFKCIKNSFIQLGSTERPADYDPKIGLEDNQILQGQQKSYNQIENYSNFPMVKINGWIFHGDVDYNQIMHFVCGHINDNLPGCYTLVDRYSEGGSAFKWISFFIILALVGGGIWYCHIHLKLKFRNELSYQIDRSVSSFLERTGTDL